MSSLFQYDILIEPTELGFFRRNSSTTMNVEGIDRERVDSRIVYVESLEEGFNVGSEVAVSAN